MRVGGKASALGPPVGCLRLTLCKYTSVQTHSWLGYSPERRGCGQEHRVVGGGP